MGGRGTPGRERIAEWYWSSYRTICSYMLHIPDKKRKKWGFLWGKGADAPMNWEVDNFSQFRANYKTMLLWQIAIREAGWRKSRICLSLSMGDICAFSESSDTDSVELSWWIRKPDVLIYYNNEVIGRPIKVKFAIQVQI